MFQTVLFIERMDALRLVTITLRLDGLGLRDALSYQEGEGWTLDLDGDVFQFGSCIYVNDPENAVAVAIAAAPE